MGATAYNMLINMPPLPPTRLQGDSSSHLVRRVDLASGGVTTLAGKAGSRGYADGLGTNAKFWNPYGVAIDNTGTFALVVSFGL